MIDLNQVSLSLRNATSRSLILLDEFGKGTLPTGLRVPHLVSPVRISLHRSCSDGAGLFCGVLKHLLGRGASCPKVIATTHFHDVFQDDLLSPYKLPITFVHMQVLLASGSHESSINPTDDNDTDDGDEDKSRVRITSGDRITYLYKYVARRHHGPALLKRGSHILELHTATLSTLTQ